MVNTSDKTHPDWSPVDDKIAYCNYFSLSGFNYKDIHIINPDGLEEKKLTEANDLNQSRSEQPRWSPDGTRIVYQYVPEGGGEYRIYTMNADGSGKKQVTSGLGGEVSPVWAPGGNYIAFSGDNGHLILYTIRSDGSGAKLLLDNGSNCYALDWMSDADDPNGPIHVDNSKFYGDYIYAITHTESQYNPEAGILTIGDDESKKGNDYYIYVPVHGDSVEYTYNYSKVTIEGVESINYSDPDASVGPLTGSATLIESDDETKGLKSCFITTTTASTPYIFLQLSLFSLF